MPRSTSSAAVAAPAATHPRTLHSTWECLRAVSRGFAAAAVAAALALALTATASAQFDVGNPYNAVTLGGGDFFDANNGGAGYTWLGSTASVEAWININPTALRDVGIAEISGFQIGGTGDLLSMVAIWDGDSINPTYTLEAIAANGFGSNTVSIQNATVMTPGTWYHVVATQGAGGVTAFVDGSASATQVLTGGFTASASWGDNAWGSAPNGGVVDPTFDGQLSGFRIWQGDIGTPSAAESAVNDASPSYTGATLQANFQMGTNGTTTPLVGIGATGGALTLTGSATYEKFGTGTVTVTDNGYFLDTIDAGVLNLGGGGSAGALTTDVVNNGTLDFERDNALTHSNVISGSGAVSQSGSGTTTLSGANTYTGATSINAGTLIVKNTTALGTTAAGTSVASGATLEFDFGQTVAEGITLNGGLLTTTSGGTVNLTGDIALGSDSLIGTGTAVADELNLAGNITGSGGFTFDGNSTTLSGTNTYDGNTIINRGDVSVTVDGALGSTNGTTQVNTIGVPMGGLVFNNVAYTTAESISLNGGFIAGSGTASFAGPISVDAASVVAEGSAASSLTLSGVISGSEALQVGSGVFTGSVILTGTNTYTGALTVSAGTLQIGAGGTTGSIATVGGVTNDASLVYDRSNDLSAGYAIGGTGTVTQAGSGTLTLSGTNTYTGNTNVNAGALNIAGSLTSDVIVAAGAAVGGAGVSTGELSGAGDVGPGNSPGILTFASVDGSAGTTFNFEFSGADPDYGNATASVNDVLRLTDATTPFTTSFDATNTVNIYIDSIGTNYSARGGFFTDLQADFLTSIQAADFNFFLQDAAGAVSYNGVNYRDVTSLNWTVTTVAASADFGAGTVNGQVMQVVPEPSSFVLAGFAIAGLAAAGYRRRKAATAAAAIAC